MARIREVWTTNLEAEMRNLRVLVERYPYVAMDTEFPGVVARPIGTFKSSTDYHYQTMRCNVDLLKIIQIGITLADEHGNLPEEVATWQFNFHFNLNEDMYAPSSVELLEKSGVDFQRHEEFGIDPAHFAELLTTSGLVLSDETTWISFHSGSDFGYFVRALTGMTLPTTDEVFFNLLKTWFPRTFDVKALVRSADPGLKGGLQEFAENLGVPRVGISHTAGADSLLTASAFFKTLATYFDGALPAGEFNGKLFGLNASAAGDATAPARGAATAAEREDRVLAGPGIGPGHSHPLGAHAGQGALGGGLSGLVGLGQPPPGLGGMGPQSQYGAIGANGAYLRSALGQR